MTIVGSLSVSLSAQTEQFDRAMQRSSRQVGEMRTAVASAQATVSGLGSTLAGLGAAVGGLALVRTALQGIVSSGVEMQRLTATFTALTGSGQGAARELDFVRRTADQMGQSVSDTAVAYRGFSGALRGTALEGQGAQTIFTQVSRAMTTLGASGDDARGVFLALQQIISKGTLTAEDFNQLVERIPGIQGIAARSLGVTTQEFVKMREAGISATQFVPKLAAQLDTELGGAADTMSKGFSGAMARLGNALKDVGAQAAQSGLLDFMARLVDKMADVIKRGPETAREMERMAQAATDRTLKGALAPGQQATRADAEELRHREDQLQRAERILAEQERKFGALPAGSPMRAEVEDLRRTRDELLARIQRGASLRESLTMPEFGGSTVSGDLAGLNKELAERVKMAEDAMAAMAKRLPFATTDEALEIRKKQLEELDRALKDIETTLGRNPALSQLLGANAASFPAAPKGASAQGWQQYGPRLAELAPWYGIDPALALALTAQESSFNPRATSPKGAMGLMQLMPGTARRFGVSDAYDPEQNMRGGLWYLSELQKQFQGNVPLMLAGYNAGEHRVQQYGGIPPFPETQHYVRTVQAGAAALQGQLGGASPTAPGAGALQTLRQQRAAIADLIDSVSADRQRGELSRTVWDEIGDRAKALQRELLTANEDIVTSTQRLIDEANARLPADQQMGEGARRLLLGRAIAVRQQQRDRGEVQELERTMTEAYEGFYDQIQQAGLRGPSPDERRQTRRETLAEEAQAIMHLTDALAAERDQLTLSEEQLLRQALARQHASQASVEMAVTLQRNNQVLQSAAQFSGLVTDSLIDMAVSGELSISRLGQAFARMALQMVVDASGIRQSLTGLFAKGIQLGVSAIGGYFGGTTYGSADGLASGGPMDAWRPYLVGERGAELVVPRMDSMVLPHAATQSLMEAMSSAGSSATAGSAGGRGITINGPLTAVYAQDVGSFQRSRGEIEAQSARALRGLQRGA